MQGDAALVLEKSRLHVIDGAVPNRDSDAKSEMFLGSVKIPK